MLSFLMLCGVCALADGGRGCLIGAWVACINIAVTQVGLHPGVQVQLALCAPEQGCSGRWCFAGFDRGFGYVRRGILVSHSCSMGQG